MKLNSRFSSRRLLWTSAVLVVSLLAVRAMQAAPNVTHTLTPTTGVWTTDTWTNGVPNAAGDIATYNTAGTATTSLDALITIGDIETGTTAGSVWNITAGGGSFVLDGTGITSGNEAFGIAGNAAIASRNAGGNLSIAPDISFGPTALDIGATNTGTVTIGGNITASANNNLNFRGSGAGIVTINGNIGASGSNLAVSNLRGSGGGVMVNGILGTSVGSVTQGASTGGNATSAMTLTNANTYTGPTQVNIGTLTFGNNAAASTVGSSTNSAFTVGQTGIGQAAVLALDSSAAIASQTITRGASLTFNAAVGGNGFTSFTQTAANVSGAKTVDNFTGALTLNTGAYVLPSLNAGTLGYGQLNFSSFVRSAGSAIDFSRGTTTATVGTTTIASQTAAKNNVTFTTAPTLTGSGTLGTTSAPILKGAVVNQIIATYDATNGLRQLNTATEMTALTASGLTNQNASLTGGGTVTLTADESVNSLTLGFGTGAGGTTAGAFNLSVTSGVISVGQTSTLGNATVDFGSAEGVIITQNTRALTINSVLTGSGGLTFVMEGSNNGTGFPILNSANTYTGVTRFIGNNNTAARLNNGLALQNSTVDYNNYGGQFVFGPAAAGTTAPTAYTFGGFTGAQNINLNNNNTTAQAVALTIGSAGSSDTASTINTYSGVLSNTVAGGSVVKAGVAIQVFSGANTYSGGTTINGGTLRVNNTTGSGTGTGAVTVGNGTTLFGTLGGSGIINVAGNTVTVNSGSNLSPGNSAGTLTIVGTQTVAAAGTSTLNLASGSNFVLELNGSTPGTQYDRVILTGTLSISNSNLSIALANNFDPTGTTFNVIAVGGTSTAALIGTFAGPVTASNNLGTYTFTPAYNGGDGNDVILTAVIAVPEPGTYAIIGLGLVLLLGMNRSRRQA